MESDGKSSFIGSVTDSKTKNEQKEIDNIECNQEAADSCPVQCIHIEK